MMYGGAGHKLKATIDNGLSGIPRISA